LKSGRLLIVAGATAASADELPESVRELTPQASEIFVVAPVLTSKLHLWTNDTDRAREQADERLTAVLGEVEAIGANADASGVVGDEVPLSAFDDAAGARQCGSHNAGRRGISLILGYASVSGWPTLLSCCLNENRPRS
jgi:hypothetical protein